MSANYVLGSREATEQAIAAFREQQRRQRLAPVPRRIRRGKNMAVRAAIRDGFTHAATFGGWVDLEEFAATESKAVDYRYDREGRRIYEVLIAPQRYEEGAAERFLLGVWPLGVASEGLPGLPGEEGAP